MTEKLTLTIPIKVYTFGPIFYSPVSRKRLRKVRRQWRKGFTEQWFPRKIEPLKLISSLSKIDTDTNLPILINTWSEGGNVREYIEIMHGINSGKHHAHHALERLLQ